MNTHFKKEKSIGEVLCFSGKHSSLKVLSDSKRPARVHPDGVGSCSDAQSVSVGPSGALQSAFLASSPREPVLWSRAYSLRSRLY